MGMINLLAPENKRQIRAARVNVVLLRHCVLLGFTALMVPVIFGAGMWLTMQERAAAESRKQENSQAAAAYADTRALAESFASDLKQAKTILSSDLSFYTLLTQIAAVVPQGVILSNLSVGTASLEAPITISARATSYEAAVNLKNSLSQSPIFSAVNLSNVSNSGGSDDLSGRYPVDATLSATFSKEFLTEVRQ